MDVGLERLQPLLVGHAEALLLIDDHQPEPLEADAFRQDGVGADDDVDRAVRHPFARRLRLGGGDEAGEATDPQGETFEPADEIVEMLAREQCRRTHDRDLQPRHRRDERAAQRDLGFAEADIADDQPVHRLARRQILQHFADRAVLIVGFGIGKPIDEAGIAARIGLGDVGGAQGARSAAIAISSPAISRMRSFIRLLRRCHASPPNRSSVAASSLP